MNYLDHYHNYCFATFLLIMIKLYIIFDILPTINLTHIIATFWVKSTTCPLFQV